MRRMVIAIDLDDTVAEFLPAWLDAINKGEGEQVERTTSWDVASHFKCGERVMEYLTYELFRNLPVKPHSQDVIKELQDYYDIYFVTSAVSIPKSLIAKVEWVQEHFPFVPLENLVLCGDKSIIHADIMIDDGVHNLEAFQGMKLLMDCSHNKAESRFIRVYDWLDIGELLRNLIH